jgi:hypothetical protein
MQVLGVGLFPAPHIRGAAPPGLMRVLALSIVRLLAFPRRPGVLAWPAGIPAARELMPGDRDVQPVQPSRPTAPRADDYARLAAIAAAVAGLGAGLGALVP